jgi:hypothetical protein
VTNSFEGTILVNPNTTDVSTFLAQLFPRLGFKETAAAVAQYAGMGPPSVQAAAIMGEGESRLHVLRRPVLIPSQQSLYVRLIPCLARLIA